MFPALSLLLFLGLAAASKVSISEFSVPPSAKVGSNVELSCRYALRERESAIFYVKWWWTPLAEPDARQQIYQRLGHHQPQSSHEGLVIKANDTIELLDLQPNDSGTYECEVSNIAEDKQKQELVVYTPGSGPQLNWTEAEEPGEEDAGLVVTCEATDVAPEPELAVTVNGKEIVANEVVVSDPLDGLYSIVLNASVADIAADSELRCELFFKHANVTHEPYLATSTYHGSGAETTTTAVEDTTEWDTTTALPDGSYSTLSNKSWVLLGVLAALAQMLAH